VTGKIAADPHDLSREAKRLRSAAGEVDTIVRPLRADLPPMPAAVRTHVEAELGWAMVALQVFGSALVEESARVNTRSSLFEKAGAGGLAALNGYLNALVSLTGSTVDALDGLAKGQRYTRLAKTWVNAYRQMRNGKLVNVRGHYRGLPPKVVNLFPWLAEDSKVARAIEAAGKAATGLSFVAAGFQEYQRDRNDDFPTRLEKARVVGVTTAGVGVVGAMAGAKVGAEACGRAGGVLGPEAALGGAIACGAAGALIGGIKGSKAGQKIGHFITGHLLPHHFP
jgi:hypothetical protein